MFGAQLNGRPVRVSFKHTLGTSPKSNKPVMVTTCVIKYDDAERETVSEATVSNHVSTQPKKRTGNWYALKAACQNLTGEQMFLLLDTFKKTIINSREGAKGQLMLDWGAAHLEDIMEYIDQKNKK